MKPGVLLLGVLLTSMVREAAGQDLERLRLGVVKVVPKNSGSGSMPATGFVVRTEAKAAFIVTAAHVVEGSDVGVEFSASRRSYPARILGMEGGDPRGLAALIVESDIPSDIQVLALNDQLDVRAGEPVIMIGFPRSIGVPWAVTRGSIVGRRGKDIVFAGAVDAGNSGGPLIKEDQVVGLITQAQGQYAYASPALIVRYALESWGVRFGVRLRNAPTELDEGQLLPLFRRMGFSHPAKWGQTFQPETGPIGMESLYGTFRHDYEERTSEAHSVIVDHATGLMWGSRDPVDRESKEAAIRDRNASRHAGFSDWRLPTIEELASLIEPQGLKEGDNFRFIDTRFDYGSCRSADSVIVRNAARTLGVSFVRGAVVATMSPLPVCPVRSLKPGELRPLPKPAADSHQTPIDRVAGFSPSGRPRRFLYAREGFTTSRVTNGKAGQTGSR